MFVAYTNVAYDGVAYMTQVDQGDLQIRHEGTDTMWADYHSKPLQGSTFCTMRIKMMNCPIDDDDVERRLTHPQLLPKHESDKGVVSLEKNTMEKAVVNCGVEIRNATLRKGSDSSMYQRAGKQLEQRRSVLGYRSGYNNGHTSKYPLDTLNGYIGKYPADTNARAVV